MPDEQRRLAEEIAARALDASRAPQTEVLVSGGREALTRFANSAIHQNLSRRSLEVSIRAADGGRTGRASTTRTDAASLAETAARALDIATHAAPLPDLLPPAEPADGYPRTHCWDAGTAAATPAMRAEGVAEIVEVAKSLELSAAGSFTSDDRFEAVANSTGLFVFGEYTSSVVSMTMTGPASTGYAEDGAPGIGRLAPRELARRAAEKARAGSSPIEAPPGVYTAILEPAAVGELLFHLLYGNGFAQFSGLAVLEGLSWFARRMGEKVFSGEITIRDDVTHPGHWGVPFDAEGVPRRPITLVHKGVVTRVTYDRATARRAGAEPTGHGLPLPNVYGSAPLHLVLDGGQTSVDEMIRSTERGILVTRLWYNRLVDPADLIVTGLTRDGTFLIEDGRIASGTRNFRINQSLRAMLSQVVALSPPVRTDSGIVAPAMKVEGFNFSAVVPREA